MLRDLLEAAPYLAAVGAGVMLLVILGRDPAGANQHDLSDYYQPAEPTTSDVDQPELPPVPAGPAVAVDEPGTPLFDELAAAAVTRPLDDEAVRSLADQWLREIGERARAELAGAR